MGMFASVCVIALQMPKRTITIYSCFFAPELPNFYSFHILTPTDNRQYLLSDMEVFGGKPLYRLENCLVILRQFSFFIPKIMISIFFPEMNYFYFDNITYLRSRRCTLHYNGTTKLHHKSLRSEFKIVCGLRIQKKGYTSGELILVKNQPRIVMFGHWVEFW